MIDSKQYNVFLNKKENYAEKNPELAFIVRGQHFKNDEGIILDTILRYVIYFYDRRCDLHSTHTNIVKAREEALRKLNIPRTVSDSPEFIEVENEMAMRYMLWNRDNEFGVFISVSFQLEELNKRLRSPNKNDSVSDAVKSMSITKDIFDLSQQIDTRRISLFGNMQHIEKFAIQKELDNKYKAETSMLG